jgi:hypothetical protein
MKHKRTTLIGSMVLLMVFASCADDRLSFERGPLGPASYEVSVEASGAFEGLELAHQATLEVNPSDQGATFSLRNPGGGVVTAEVSAQPDGSLNLTHIRGIPVEGPGETELASLVGQLTPPLPQSPVRIGERWSDTREITTNSLRASIDTDLRLVRFRRVASTDAAELAGKVNGTTLVAAGIAALSGELAGNTRIVWAVEEGRVVESETELTWTLDDGTQVTIHTRVQPR